MRQSRLSGSVEGVMGNHDSYSDLNDLRFASFRDAGLDEVKNSAGMNHALRNLRLVESSVALKA